MAHFLRKSIGSWSAGTRVELLNWPGSPQPFQTKEGTVEVRVLAGDKPIIEVLESDLVERRSRERTI